MTDLPSEETPPMRYPVEELLAEWFPDFDDDEVARCATMVRDAVRAEKYMDAET